MKHTALNIPHKASKGLFEVVGVLRKPRITDNPAQDDPGNQKVRAPALGFGSADYSKSQLSLRELDYRLMCDRRCSNDTKSRLT
jgi:hypothetical protein